MRAQPKAAGPALESGESDVVPEYAARMAEYLNARKNGHEAPVNAPIATSDPAETVAAMAQCGESSF